MKQMSIDRLRDYFRLDADTGKLYWRFGLGSSAEGSEAGSLDAKGYVQIQIHRQMYKAHRIIFAMTHGRWPDKQVDHINGVKNDNRPVNLREATNMQNQYNTGLPKHNTSGVKGVSWKKTEGKWRVGIKVAKRLIYLGSYRDIEQAKRVIEEAQRKYYGEFARGAIESAQEAAK